MDYQALLVQHLDTVKRIVRLIARRYRLPAADAEEFASVVRLKLVEHDFSILRKFEGRSSLTTYLTVVVERLCLDFCIARWGKWRPSASARRLGSVATLLEELIVREGITFDEAVGTLQINHGVTETRDQLHDMLLQFPRRTPRHFTHESLDELTPDRVAALSYSAAHDPADRLVVERVEIALAAALGELADEDREIVTLHYDAGLPLAQVARSLGRDVRGLYRRLNQIIGQLRFGMQRRGIEPADMARAIARQAPSMGNVLVELGRRPR